MESFRAKLLWTYEVPGTSLACKKGTEFCVDHVIVAHGWQPINSSNRNLRIRIRTAVGSPVQSSDFLVQLDEGSPTFSSLASELSTKLSALHTSTFAVTWNSATFQFRVQQSGTQAYGFQTLSDEELETMPFSGALVTNPMSANRILGILSATACSVGSDTDGFTNLADYGTAIICASTHSDLCVGGWVGRRFPNAALQEPCRRWRRRRASGSWKSSVRTGF